MILLSNVAALKVDHYNGAAARVVFEVQVGDLTMPLVVEFTSEAALRRALFQFNPRPPEIRGQPKGRK